MTELQPWRLNKGIFRFHRRCEVFYYHILLDRSQTLLNPHSAGKIKIDHSASIWTVEANPSTNPLQGRPWVPECSVTILFPATSLSIPSPHQSPTYSKTLANELSMARKVRSGAQNYHLSWTQIGVQRLAFRVLSCHFLPSKDDEMGPSICYATCWEVKERVWYV